MHIYSDSKFTKYFKKRNTEYLKAVLHLLINVKCEGFFFYTHQQRVLQCKLEKGDVVFLVELLLSFTA